MQAQRQPGNPVIEIVPIGSVAPDIMRQLPLILEERFPGRKVIIAQQGLEQPDYAYTPERNQYEAEPILERLARFNPQAERILGVADLDLYAPGLNFIFGQAQIGGPAGIIALARLHPEFWGQPANPALLAQRTIKEAVHELGHTYGLQHCPISTCVMHFSNTLAETDLKSSQFCPQHEAQLLRALGREGWI
jgi:archaemetzincin